MVAETSRDLIGADVPRYPLDSIPDDGAYRAVIRVLDRLFERGEGRTPAENDWYRSLARLAHRYELDHPACWA